MNFLKVQTPAKINLTLDVIGLLDNGFHELKSIMHSINLYDYLTFKISKSDVNEIILNGNSAQIPYNEKNLVWKAASKFFDYAKISNTKLDVYIEKNIPIEAGMAGGSSDAAATLYALNYLFNKIISDNQINEIASSLGSDINFCLQGGCAICTSRGEKIQRIIPLNLPISLIKPKNLGISAKEAFEYFDSLSLHNKIISTDIMVYEINNGNFSDALIHNDLEVAMLNKYPQLNIFKNSNQKIVMTGSGSAFYTISEKFADKFNQKEFLIIENLRTINEGIKIIDER